ncbi:33184_t:CDS:2 [Racocetra persica]|uniref:33184_t:CDS:1 n=1 Tax=Racocetra persica TaxID=160502 RepID=A0ACA9MTC7_9GLOM|nr:33184_t:CDS:2 [Racocetra persica]
MSTPNQKCHKCQSNLTPSHFFNREKEYRVCSPCMEEMKRELESKGEKAELWDNFFSCINEQGIESEQLSSISVKNNVERVVVFDNAKCSNCEMKEIEEELKKDGERDNNLTQQSQLQSEISTLESNPNKTPEQEQELEEKKRKLAELEAKLRELEEKNKTDNSTGNEDKGGIVRRGERKFKNQELSKNHIRIDQEGNVETSQKVSRLDKTKKVAEITLEVIKPIALAVGVVHAVVVIATTHACRIM